MPGRPQPEDRFPSSNPDDLISSDRRPSGGQAGNKPADKSATNRTLDEPELISALQLLVERAQYITGATGTALALPQGDEMVCRASAGSSAPAVGARLQVRSGLTGESISRRQLLRCDNAETDPRVNLEACRDLGIASIVVLPLFSNNGEVRGLIELFSDHPYAFEERDLIALERMADLTLTALDLAEQQSGFGSTAASRQNHFQAESTENPKSAPEADNARQVPGNLVQNEHEGPPAVPDNLPVFSHSASQNSSLPSSSFSPQNSVPEALRRQKCSSCGFPISDGRMICLDCENKNQIGVANKEIEDKKEEKKEEEKGDKALESNPGSLELKPSSSRQEEFIPAFLANAVPVKESWFGNHVNILAIIVLIMCILVAVAVFR